MADPVANQESDTRTLQPLEAKLDNADIMSITGDFTTQTTTRDLEAAKHSQRIEWTIVATLETTIVLSSSFLGASAFRGPKSESKTMDRLINFSSSSGTTAVGALVAVLVRRNSLSN
ncbi:hypothetical protein OMCYN_01714 [cyanobiont of Ornithocercus magnificus]|nr:hypothetical protein OMCYN_01714 [cyanobiont of Ornithocercus magnificus]